MRANKSCARLKIVIKRGATKFSRNAHQPLLTVIEIPFFSNPNNTQTHVSESEITTCSFSLIIFKTLRNAFPSHGSKIGPRDGTSIPSRPSKPSCYPCLVLFLSTYIYFIRLPRQNRAPSRDGENFFGNTSVRAPKKKKLRTSGSRGPCPLARAEEVAMRGLLNRLNRRTGEFNAN